MVLVWGFLEIVKKITHFFTLECFSRDSIGRIVKIDGTIVGVKYKTILEDDVLPFSGETMTPG